MYDHKGLKLKKRKKRPYLSKENILKLSNEKYTLNKIKGATMIEYVLIVGIISIAAITLLSTVGTKVSNLFTSIVTALTTAGG